MHVISTAAGITIFCMLKNSSYLMLLITRCNTLLMNLDAGMHALAGGKTVQKWELNKKCEAADTIPGRPTKNINEA